MSGFGIPSTWKRATGHYWSICITMSVEFSPYSCSDSPHIGFERFARIKI
jgi:hypothetical protein